MRVTNEQARIEVMCAGKKDCHECELNPLRCLEGRGSPEDYAADLLEARELIKEMRAFCKDIADNYDCDSDGHRYNTGCRSCKAEEILDRTKDYAE